MPICRKTGTCWVALQFQKILYAQAKLLASPRGGISKTQTQTGDHYILTFSKARGTATHSHHREDRGGRKACCHLSDSGSLWQTWPSIWGQQHVTVVKYRG